LTRARDDRTPKFFLGILLLYLAFSPFAISGMGYASEDMSACRELIAGTPLSRIHWPRNGAAGLVVECPFLAAAAIAGDSPAWDDRLLALEPVLATAALVTLLLAWCTRLSDSRLWGLTLALIAGLCTMLWPYAYIGLETTQSLFLVAAGYLALTAQGPLRWPRAVAFGLCAGLAVSAKSGGFMLLPAAAFLAWRLFRSDRTAGRSGASAVAAMFLCLTIFALNSVARVASWERFGGTAHLARWWVVRDVVSPFLNAVALVGSPNKGLLVFAPVAVLGLLSLPRAYRADRGVAAFAGLTFAGLAGGVSLLAMWSDETWGPRYLHSAIGPLVLCVAASRSTTRLRVRSEAPLWACAVFGLAVSFLGSAFYYGTLGGVATETHPMTLESLQGDPVWNHVRFNAHLLSVWLRVRTRHADSPDYWRRGREWDWKDPAHYGPWNNVDLRERAVPQPLLLQIGQPSSSAKMRGLRGFCLLALIAGIGILVSEARRARSLEPPRGGS
jgi:hypothetical protein